MIIDTEKYRKLIKHMREEAQDYRSGKTLGRAFVDAEDVLDEAADAIGDLLAALTPPNEWVSVEDRLPEYNPGTGARSYWVAKKDNAGNWQMKIAQYCDYGYAMNVDAKTEVTWRDRDFTKIVNVTHWMPLPKSPKEDE